MAASGVPALLASSWKGRCVALLDSTPSSAFLGVCTIAALYLDDFRLAFLPEKADSAVFAIITVVVLVFLVELVINSVCRIGYARTFFFLLDILAVVSLITEIPWLWDPILDMVGMSDSSHGTQKTLELSRAARAARVGARAARVVRIVRLRRRVSQTVPASKQAPAQPKQQPGSPPHIARRPSTTPPSLCRRCLLCFRWYRKHTSETSDASTKVGRDLSAKTVRCVVTIVLLTLLVTPFLLYKTENHSPAYGLEQLNGLCQGSHSNHSAPLTERQPVTDDTGLLAAIDEYEQYNSDDGELVSLRVNGAFCNYSLLSSTLSLLRSCEINRYVTPDGNAEAIWSEKPKSVALSIYNMVITTVVTIVLAGAAFLFSYDAEKLIIRPIQRMVRVIERLQGNPLAHLAMQQNMADFNPQVETETQILERTFEKLTGLIQISLGESGSVIVQRNITSAYELVPLVAGERTDAVFGVVSLRDFALLTEALEERITLFVNEIANIVHNECRAFGGSINRNTGDSFVVVWRLPSKAAPARDKERSPAEKGEQEREKGRGTLSAGGGTLTRESSVAGSVGSAGSRSTGSQNDDSGSKQGPPPLQSKDFGSLADQALGAFLRVMIRIATSTRLYNWLEDPRIRAVFNGTSVNMSFGLHAGWAIEGAVGSRFKIDPSYLSPHVSLAFRIVAAAQLYTLPLLLSETFYSLLSPEAKRRTRRVDVVKAEGLSSPIGLYTVDVVLSTLMQRMEESPPQPHVGPSVIGMTSQEIQRRKTIFLRYMNRQEVHQLDFAGDKDLVALQEPIDPDFAMIFAEGLNRYQAGNWQSAAERFKEACSSTMVSITL